MVLLDVGLQFAPDLEVGPHPIHVAQIAVLVVPQDPVSVKGGGVVHLLDIWTRFGRHGYPPQGGDALADCREVVEHVAAPVSLAECLYFLNLLRYGFQKDSNFILLGLLVLRDHEKKSTLFLESTMYHFRMSLYVASKDSAVL